MKIEIRNIKIAPNLSEETIAFTADVYVGGVKTAYAKNDGQGGCTFYNAYENKRELLAEAEAYAKSLPSKTEMFNGKPFTIDSNLEQIIDDAVHVKDQEREQKKFEKKIEKMCEKAVVWGDPKTGKVSAIGFNGNPKFSDMLKTTNGTEAIKKLADRIKTELKTGEEILNKNIVF